MSLFDLKGRVAIVTGGNGGIGLGMARGLARAGAGVMVAGRNREKSAAAVSELSALGVKAGSVETDVTSEASCAAMVAATLEAFGRIDILVANAGMNRRVRPEQLSAEVWHEVVDTNLSSVFLCAKAVHPAMKRQGGGKIITIGSMLSVLAAPFSPAYGAAKGGVVQLTRSLAAAWAGDNIQANAVLPGWIDTDMTVAARTQVEGLYDRVLSRTPAGRWGTPADFEGIATFLASPASDYVTGAAIPVDGGHLISW